MELPKEPVLFIKALSALTGPNDPVVLPQGAEKGDWEVELGVVIGTRARYVTEAEALSHVAGCCVVNDVSERAYQLERGGTWDKGKGADTFGPVGPWLVTADEVPDPQSLRLWLDVSGERMQDGTTKTMVFGVAQLVSYISRFMTLEPGDLIATGTPAGVGMGCKPPRFLRAGRHAAARHRGPRRAVDGRARVGRGAARPDPRQALTRPRRRLAARLRAMRRFLRLLTLWLLALAFPIQGATAATAMPMASPHAARHAMHHDMSAMAGMDDGARRHAVRAPRDRQVRLLRRLLRAGREPAGRAGRRAGGRRVGAGRAPRAAGRRSGVPDRRARPAASLLPRLTRRAWRAHVRSHAHNARRPGGSRSLARAGSSVEDRHDFHSIRRPRGTLARRGLGRRERARGLRRPRHRRQRRRRACRRAGPRAASTSSGSRTDAARAQARDDVAAALRQPLGEDDAVRIALSYSPALQAVLFDRAAASADATQSARLPNPVFTLRAAGQRWRARPHRGHAFADAAAGRPAAIAQPHPGRRRDAAAPAAAAGGRRAAQRRRRARGLGRRRRGGPVGALRARRCATPPRPAPRSRAAWRPRATSARCNARAKRPSRPTRSPSSRRRARAARRRARRSCARSVSTPARPLR